MRPDRLKSLTTKLVDMRVRLIDEVQHVEDDIRENVGAAGDVSSAPTHPADSADEGLDRNLAVAQNEEQLLEQVEAALRRVEQGTYGTCIQCGGEIAAPRLDAVPYAALCIRCAQKNEKK